MIPFGSSFFIILQFQKFSTSLRCPLHPTTVNVGCGSTDAHQMVPFGSLFFKILQFLRKDTTQMPPASSKHNIQQFDCTPTGSVWLNIIFQSFQLLREHQITIWCSYPCCWYTFLTKGLQHKSPEEGSLGINVLSSLSTNPWVRVHTSPRSTQTMFRVTISAALEIMVPCILAQVSLYGRDLTDMRLVIKVQIWRKMVHFHLVS